MEYTAIKELFKRFGHLLPDIENEFLLKEKEQMEQPTELEKRIWEILDKTGMNPMLQQTTCDRILAVVNKLSKARVIESLPFCDDDSYGYDELGLCNDCGLERTPNGNVSGQLPQSQITDKEYKGLIKSLYPKYRSKKFRR